MRLVPVLAFSEHDYGKDSLACQFVDALARDSENRSNCVGIPKGLKS